MVAQLAGVFPRVSLQVKCKLVLSHNFNHRNGSTDFINSPPPPRTSNFTNIHSAVLKLLHVNKRHLRS
jgi:hypothetical protein